MFTAGKYAGTALRFLRSWAGPLAAGYTAKELADIFDPSGNFGGFTSPIDNWSKAHLGFDPSHVTADDTSKVSGWLTGGYTPTKNSAGPANMPTLGGSDFGGPANMLTDVKTKSDEASAALQKVAEPVAVSVDASSIEALLAQLERAHSLLASIGAGVAAASGGLSPLGKTAGGHFGLSGVNGG